MRQHFVIGTAGHIDHGKSAVVKALTGTDPDRLEEEQRRGMTIDLGFAHFDLPDGRRVGIVDVPGHERLIKNMLAGATGIDLVLLVVASDEGVMPQTREHLDILRFLPVRAGIVVLNKIDLVQDPAWVALVRDDIALLARGTFLEGAPVVEVSAKTGQGMPALVEAISRTLGVIPPRSGQAPARLPVDRSFTMPGFGTVVTGTLWSGQITPGDVLELLPEGKTVRVRGVQSHGQQVDVGVAGSRVAVNLAGIDKREIVRGDVLATPRVFAPTSLVDVRVRLLPDARPLAHLARVRVYLGSHEGIGRLALLETSKLEPGGETTGQLRLERPTIADAGDPFVIRRYSPMLTLGGGRVLDAHPPLRKRGESRTVAAAASLQERVEAAVEAAGTTGATAEDLMPRVAAGKVQVQETLQHLVDNGRILQLRGRVFHGRVGDQVAAALTYAVAAHHEAVPWRAGIPKDDLKARAFGGGDNRLYAHVLEHLVADGALEDTGEFIRRPGFVPSATPQEAALRERIAAELLRGKFAPPGREALAQGSDPAVFERVLRTLFDDGTVVEVAPGVYFHKDVLAEIKRVVAGEVASKGSITVASLRDRLQTSRKYALTVLEHFDAIKLTRRVGEARVLR